VTRRTKPAGRPSFGESIAELAVARPLVRRSKTGTTQRPQLIAKTPGRHFVCFGVPKAQ
jgi:hypothetical protein